MRTTPTESISIVDWNSSEESDFLDQLIPLREVRLPSSRPGKRTHLSTLIRWIQRGTRTPDGRRVKLRAARVGWAWMTTRTWVREFIEAISTTPSDTATVPINPGAGATTAKSRLSPERRRAAEAAQAELRRLGMGA